MASSQRPSGQLQVDDSRWVVVYPAYLNADYSFAKVRRPRGGGQPARWRGEKLSL